MAEIQTPNRQIEKNSPKNIKEQFDNNLNKLNHSESKSRLKKESKDFVESHFDFERNNIEQNSIQIISTLSNVTSTNNINNYSPLVARENMDHFFGRLQSASKLKIINTENISITNNKEERKQILDTDNLNDPKINSNTSNTKSNKSNNTANTLKNTKNSSFNNYKANTLRGQRDTIILDQKLNVLEVLNERNNLLITESNENNSDSSREESNNKYPLNLNYLHKASLDKNINEFNFRKFEKGFSQHENYLTYDNFMNSNKKEGLNEKISTLNDLGRKVNAIAFNSTKNTYTSQNFNINNKKILTNTGTSRHSKMTKSTDMSSIKSSINSESISGSASSKINSRIKNKVASLNPPSKGPHIAKKVPFTSKNLDSKLKDSHANSKTPKRTFTPVIERTKNIIISNSNKKVYLSNKTSVNTSKIISDKNYIQNKEQKFRPSLTSNKDDSYSINKSKFDTVTLPIRSENLDEYDYSKILVELKSIFGENLEHFDENCMLLF